MVRWQRWLGAACLSTCAGCIFPDHVTCSDPPDEDFLLIDKARAPLIDHFTVDGPCTVIEPAQGCDGGDCPTLVDKSYVYHVKRLAPAACTVTVSFTDGSRPLVVFYRYAKVCPT